MVDQYRELTVYILGNREDIHKTIENTYIL